MSSELLEPLINSPRLPFYVEELGRIIDTERAKREKFYAEMKEDQKVEFINGEVVMQSLARLRHVEASDNLNTLLRVFVAKNDLGVVLHEKILVCLTRNDYEPDICFFSKEKASRFTPDQMKFPAPDFVVEVLSPSTQDKDRGVKYEDYALSEVDEYWIVDPDEQSIEQHLLAGEKYMLIAKQKDGHITSRAIPGLILPVRAVFDRVENLQTLRHLSEAVT